MRGYCWLVLIGALSILPADLLVVVACAVHSFQELPYCRVPHPAERAPHFVQGSSATPLEFISAMGALSAAIGRWRLLQLRPTRTASEQLAAGVILGMQLTAPRAPRTRSLHS